VKTLGLRDKCFSLPQNNFQILAPIAVALWAQRLLAAAKASRAQSCAHAPSTGSRRVNAAHGEGR
jgi:hypothetical protein